MNEAQIMSLATVDLAGDRRRVLELVRDCGGITGDEAEAFLDMDRLSAHRALSDLRSLGLVKDSGERRALNRKDQTVWAEGDDRDVVLAQRKRKLAKLADALGFDVIERKVIG